MVMFYQTQGDIGIWLVSLNLQSHPDIAFSASMLSQFISSPRTTHQDAILHICHFEILPKGTPGQFISYNDHNQCEIRGFSCTNWDDYPIDQRSTSEQCVFVSGN